MRGLGAARRLQRSLQLAPSVEGAAVKEALGSHNVAAAAPCLGSCHVLAPAACTSHRSSSEVHPPPAPWPINRRALHCSGGAQQTAAMPQAAQQQAAVPEPCSSVALDAASAASASAATALSGLAAKLSSGDPFLNSVEATAGPIVAYKEGRLKGAYRKDERQELTITRIQQVYDDLQARLGGDRSLRKGRGLTLLDAAPASIGSGGGGWFGGLFGGGGGRDESTAAAAPVQGLYMYGGVGVGKTMLMDLLAQTAPPNFNLERTHFHDFMIGVHQKLRHFASVADPLAHVADGIADRISVLCLDELFVTDVADAMILHRLFGRLWDRGLVLVATSNRHPDALYEGGLQRSLFLPFIQRLKEACAVHDMNSRTDYRKLAHHSRGLYFVTPTREEDLYERFMELVNGQPVRPAWVDVAMGRQLEMPRTGGCATLFTFDELCNRPLGAADYIALANAKHTVALSGVPVFTAANRQTAYRFVTLVDVLYEHRVRFLCSAEAMPFELFENVKTQQEARAAPPSPSEVVDDNLGFAKDRTISRLTEMQSEEYLRAHAKAHAPELLLAMNENKAAAAAAGGSRR